MSEPPQFRAYLGDAVYVSWDGFHVVLTTENGKHISNRISLDPEVWRNLMRYHERLKTLIKNQSGADE